MLAKVEKEKSNLEKELSDSRKEIIELKKQIPSPNFIEYMGAKFKRKPSGGYENSVYCPSCEAGMATIDSDIPFVCGKCHALTTFTGHNLPFILKEIGIEHP